MRLTEAEERPGRHSCVGNLEGELGRAVKRQCAVSVVRDAERPQAADAVVERANIGIGGVGFGRVDGKGIEAGLGGERDAEIEHDFLFRFQWRNREPELRIARGEEEVAHAVMELDADRRQGDGRVGLEEDADGGPVEQLEIPGGGAVAVEDGGCDEFEFAVAVAGFGCRQNVRGYKGGPQIGGDGGVMTVGDGAGFRGGRGLVQVEVAAHAIFGRAVVNEAALRKQEAAIA